MVELNGKAFVYLNIINVSPDPDPCAGDNYQVEISTKSNFSEIEAKTPILEAWKRIYVEKDRMYKEGQDLSADCGPTYPPANWVRISSTSKFDNHEGEQIHILS